MAKKKSRRPSTVSAQAFVHLRREVAALQVLIEDMSQRLDSVRNTAETSVRRCAELQAELDVLKKSRSLALTADLP